MWNWIRGLVILMAMIDMPLFAQQRPHVAVVQMVEHPALNTLRQNLQRALEEQGYKKDQTLDWTYENAQGNPATAVQICHKLVSLQPTVMVTLSTPVTQSAASTTSTIPIVFGAVTDPKAAKLTTKANISGITDFVPPEKQLDLVHALLPKAKSLGLVFNAGEVNSREQADVIKALAARRGLHCVEATVSKTSEVTQAVKSLIGRVDAILLPTDNTVISALESVVKVASAHKIPVFGSDVDIVRRGATAAYGVNWEESGRDLGHRVGVILKGKRPLPTSGPKTLELHLNAKALEKMRISVPEELKTAADKIF